MKKITILAVLIFLVFQSPAHSAMYKWVDENGKTHFTDNPSKIPQNSKSKGQYKKFAQPGLKKGKSLSKAAYHEIMANVFDYKKIQKAVKNLVKAKELNPSDPWIYITGSMVELINGYNGNDRYDSKNYDEDSVVKGFTLAQHAVQLEPKESMAHSNMARFHILTKNYNLAMSSINLAMKLDRENYSPWFIKGILFEKQKKWDRAKINFGEAEKRATFKYQKMILTSHRINIANQMRNMVEMERLLRLNIHENPENIWMYDNYGDFLMGRKRYKEAKATWEKAVSIKPYQRGLRQIKRASEMIK